MTTAALSKVSIYQVVRKDGMELNCGPTSLA